MNSSKRVIILSCSILTSLYCHPVLSATCQTATECCAQICSDLTKRCKLVSSQTVYKCPVGFMLSDDNTCVVTSARPPRPQNDDTGYYVTNYYSGTCAATSTVESCYGVITVPVGDETYPLCPCQSN